MTLYRESLTIVKFNCLFSVFTPDGILKKDELINHACFCYQYVSIYMHEQFRRKDYLTENVFISILDDDE
jgi:hypothetical protein